MIRVTIILLTVICIGCGPTPYYSDNYEIDPLGWVSDDAILFQPEITDTSATYELQLVIDHTNEYRYENIYFRINTIFPDRPETEENLSIDLATKKGQWVGNCSGDDCKLKVYLLENFKFPSKGTYGFKLRQYTRDEALTGIAGITMELFQKEIEAK